METNVLIIVINYNYSEFILRRKNIWTTLGSKFDLVLVDDQSTDKCERDLIAVFGEKNFIQTSNVKNIDNSINQINAIFYGCDNFLRNKHSHIWVIDADDYPVLDNLNSLDYLEKGSTYVFSSELFDEVNSNTRTIIPRKKFFWYSNLATSQIIASVEDFKSASALLKSQKFKDFWYDARLNLSLHSKIKICQKTIVCRCVHGANDSLRYSSRLVTRLKKYISAFYLKWQVSRL